jgi:hypothetical protein
VRSRIHPTPIEVIPDEIAGKARIDNCPHVHYLTRAHRLTDKTVQQMSRAIAKHQIALRLPPLHKCKAEALVILRQIAAGAAAVHQPTVINPCVLKAGNIFITLGKAFDFGAPVIIDDGITCVLARQMGHQIGDFGRTSWSQPSVDEALDSGIRIACRP